MRVPETYSLVPSPSFSVWQWYIWPWLVRREMSTCPHSHHSSPNPTRPANLYYPFPPILIKPACEPTPKSPFHPAPLAGLTPAATPPIHQPHGHVGTLSQCRQLTTTETEDKSGKMCSNRDSNQGNEGGTWVTTTLCFTLCGFVEFFLKYTW
jgi:hypothetical protein